jgi:anti-sigma regulatory factor (Ser/Thr protein kinase)
VLRPFPVPARAVLRRRFRLPSTREPAGPGNGRCGTSSSWARWPGAVPCARLHTRQVLWEWGLSGLAGDTELLVSEMVTNAVAASRSLGRIVPVRLWLLADKAQVMILVWDGCPRPPAPVPGIREDAESGRGLLLVEALSERWGWYYPQGQGTGGKTTWALIRAELR